MTTVIGTLNSPHFIEPMYVTEQFSPEIFKFNQLVTYLVCPS